MKRVASGDVDEMEWGGRCAFPARAGNVSDTAQLAAAAQAAAR